MTAELTLITKTGHLTLLVDVRTNFVVTAFIGLLSIPRGGTSYEGDIKRVWRGHWGGEGVSVMIVQ